MNYYLSFWHYFSFIIYFILFLIVIIYGSRHKIFRNNAKSLLGVLFTLVLMLIVTTALLIDNYTKEVTLIHFKHRRFYPTEQIFFAGSIRNTGTSPVSTVELEIKLVNKDTGHIEGGASYQSTVFESFFGRNDKKHRPNTLFYRQRIATDLKPGQTRQFHIATDYPTYFKGFNVQPKLNIH